MFKKHLLSQYTEEASGAPSNDATVSDAVAMETSAPDSHVATAAAAAVAAEAAAAAATAEMEMPAAKKAKIDVKLTRKKHERKH